MTTQSIANAKNAAPSPAANSHSRDDLLESAARLRTEVGKRIVGQEQVVEEVIMAMLAGGHALLVGVPGLAKTLMISSIDTVTM